MNEEKFMHITLRVPQGSLQRYLSDDWWGQFWEIQEVDCDTFAMGDVNRDEMLDVDDVNAIINIILELKASADYKGIVDIDGSGIVDVDDVNAVINIILGQN